MLGGAVNGVVTPTQSGKLLWISPCKTIHLQDCTKEQECTITDFSDIFAEFCSVALGA